MSNQEKELKQNEVNKKEKSPKKKQHKKGNGIFSFSGKRFQNGTYSAAMILVAIAIVIVINLIVSKVPAEYTEYDVSGNNLYSMGKESDKLLKNLKEDVTIYYLVSSTAKSSYPEITKLLEQYEKKSDHIKLELKDPELYPNFGSQYDAGETTVLIVESEKRFKLVEYDELYAISNTEDYYYYGANAEYEFNGENSVANAINYVVTDNLPKAYVLQGNGEAALDENIQGMVEDGNVTVENLNLMSKGSVPKDADCLIIIAPQNDYSKEQADAIKKYLKNGGNGIIFSDYLGADKKLPNFMSVLEEFGVTIEDGLVYEGDSNYSYQNVPLYIIPDIKSLDASKDMVESNQRVLTPNSQSIKTLEDKRDTTNVASLLSTSNLAYIKKNPESAKTTEKEDGDKEGTYDIGVVITETEKAEGEEESETETSEENIKTKLVVFGSSALVDGDIYSSVTKSNATLFTSTLGWMCDCEDSISIASKSITEESLTITDSEVNLWMSVYLILIPTAVIVTGIVVAVRRRRK